jgi:hypothetical protein
MTTAWKALAAMVLAAAIVCCAASGTAAPAPAPRVAGQWEYCEIQYSTRIIANPAPAVVNPGRGRMGKGGGPGARRQMVMVWVSGEEEVEGNGWEDLASKLKVPAGKRNLPASAHKIRVFNHLGADGWELVASQQDPSTGWPAWTFKRRARK